MSNYFNQTPWLDETIRILLYFASAWLIAILLKPIVHRAINLGKLTPNGRKPSPERQVTLQRLISSAISLIAFIIAVLVSLGLFIQPNTLAWMFG